MGGEGIYHNLPSPCLGIKNLTYISIFDACKFKLFLFTGNILPLTRSEVASLLTKVIVRHVGSQEKEWFKLTFFLKYSTKVLFSQSQVFLWIQTVPATLLVHLLPNAPSECESKRV